MLITNSIKRNLSGNIVLNCVILKHKYPNTTLSYGCLPSGSSAVVFFYLHLIELNGGDAFQFQTSSAKHLDVLNALVLMCLHILWHLTCSFILCCFMVMQHVILISFAQITAIFFCSGNIDLVALKVRRRLGENALNAERYIIVVKWHDFML